MSDRKVKNGSYDLATCQHLVSSLISPIVEGILISKLTMAMSNGLNWALCIVGNYSSLKYKYVFETLQWKVMENILVNIPSIEGFPLIAKV